MQILFFGCTFGIDRVYTEIFQGSIPIISLEIIQKIHKVTVGIGDENSEFISSFKEILAEARSVI